MKKIQKRLLSLVLAVAMVLSMSMSVFASETTSPRTVKVKFFINQECLTTGEVPSGYTTYSDAYLESATFTVNIDQITGCPVQKPDGFKGLFDIDGIDYVPTAFDAIYNAAVTQKGETNQDFVYGFDTQYTKPHENGIYVQKLSGLGTETLESTDSYWFGTSWAFYVVPGDEFDPANPDETYKSDYYPNNVDLQAGKTYYMVYDYSVANW